MRPLATWFTRRLLVVPCGVALIATAVGCTTSPAPTAPSSGTSRSGSRSALLTDRAPAENPGGPRDPFATLNAVFPPRDQSLRFRQELEAVYRDVLRRGASTSFVDLEGTIVWTHEYLRYRVNGCSHAVAVARVMAIIDGGAIGPECSTSSTPFPPRNEPFQFRQDLEVKYRDTLRRSPTTTYVDTEGDIVWTQEYFRYRTIGCSDSDASMRVIAQVRGEQASATCSGSCTQTVSEPVVTFNRDGGSRSVTVTTGDGCAWTAVSDSSWLTVTSGQSASGNGTIRYTVAPLAPPAQRTGRITVGNTSITVHQVAESESIVARFVMRQGGTPTGSCNLGGSGASNCSLDGTSSTGTITTYQWVTIHYRTTGGNVQRTYSGSVVNLGSISCTVQGNSQERFDITLTISNGAGQTASSTQSLSFSRAGCGT